VAGVGCEAAVEAELEDNARWRGRRGTDYLMAAAMILSYVLRCS
jgi:hypothetical protein